MRDFGLDVEAQQTDDELATRIAELQSMSQSDVERLLPERMDQELLDNLIQKVNAATGENEKKAIIIENIGNVGEVVSNAVIALARNVR